MKYIWPPKWTKPRFFKTTKVDKLMPQLAIEVPKERIKVRGGPFWRRGPWTRLDEVRKSVTELVDKERVELFYWRGWETRLYTERLIAEAMRFGPRHRHTLEVAAFYLSRRRDLLEKLFQVLVPRYLHALGPFTEQHVLSHNSRLALEHNAEKRTRLAIKSTVPLTVVQLVDNGLPPLRQPAPEAGDFLTNVLLRAAQSKKGADESTRSQ